MNKMILKFFFFSFLFVSLDLLALQQSVGCFSPFFGCTPKEKEEILHHYDVGTKLDKEITARDFCKTRNVLYANCADGEFAVVSELYPVDIQGIAIYGIKSTFQGKVLCLPQILLSDEEFQELNKFISTLNECQEWKNKLSDNRFRGKRVSCEFYENSLKFASCLRQVSLNLDTYRNVLISYINKLSEYVRFISEIRGMEDQETSEEIERHAQEVSAWNCSDIFKTKDFFDEKLVPITKKYIHSETSFLYYCNKKRIPFPSVFFTKRDMCPICEDVIVKTMRSRKNSVIVVSVREHKNSWERHDGSEKNVRKVVMDTSVEFSKELSPLTDLKKISKLIEKHEQLCSPRGISLLFQQNEIPKECKELYISDTELCQAIRKLGKDCKFHLEGDKLSKLDRSIKIFQGVVDDMVKGKEKEVTIKKLKDAIMPSTYIDHIIDLLKATE